MKKQYIALTSAFILTVYLSPSIFSQDISSNQSNCAKKIRQSIKKEDYINIIRNDGLDFAGYLKNIKSDSLTIKLKSDRAYQSPSLMNIGICDIDSISFNGIHNEYTFFNSKNLAVLGGITGFISAFASSHDIRYNYENHTGDIVGWTVGGAIAGAAIGYIFQAAGKKEVPVNIVINCSH